jgi:hypothetical protein
MHKNVIFNGRSAKEILSAADAVDFGNKSESPTEVGPLNQNLKTV